MNSCTNQTSSLLFGNFKVFIIDIKESTISYFLFIGFFSFFLLTFDCLFIETFYWNFYWTYYWTFYWDFSLNFILRLFIETFHWDFLLRLFIETFYLYWDFLLRLFIETFYWDFDFPQYFFDFKVFIIDINESTISNYVFIDFFSFFLLTFDCLLIEITYWDFLLMLF